MATIETPPTSPAPTPAGAAPAIPAIPAIPGLGWRLYVRLGLIGFRQLLGLLSIDLVAALLRRRSLATSAGRRVRMTFARLGPMYDKIAELLISHASVAPGAMLTGYEVAPPPTYRTVSAKRIREIIAADLGDGAFRSFTTEPFKITALAQYHRASLPDGTDVAVKVRRPGIEDTKPPQRMGILLLGIFSRRLLPPGVNIDQMGLMMDLGLGFQKQMDFRNEVTNLEQVAEVLSSRGLGGVVIPRPVEGMATERVLVTTFVDGVPLDQFSDPTTVARAANQGAELLFACAAHGGAFNADLRASNLLVRSDGTLGIVGFEDCCALDATQASGLRQLLEAVASGDERREVAALDALGAIPDTVDRRALLARLAWLRHDKGDLWGRDPLHGLPHLFQSVEDFGLTVPVPVFRLGEGIMYLEGACRRVGTTPDLAAHLPAPTDDFVDGYGPALSAEEVASAELLAKAFVDPSFRGMLKLVPERFRPRREHLVQQLPFLLILPVFLVYGTRWGIAAIVAQQSATAVVRRLRGQPIGTGTKWIIGLAGGFGLLGIVFNNAALAFIPGLVPSLVINLVMLGTFVVKRPVVGLLSNFIWPLPPAIRQDPVIARRIWVLSVVHVTLSTGRQVVGIILLLTAAPEVYLVYRQVSNLLSQNITLPIIWLAKKGVAKAPEIEARLIEQSRQLSTATTVSTA